MMEKVAAALLIAAGIVFAGSILGALLGGLSGWIVGFFWTEPILNFLQRFGADTQGLTVWQIGVALGFMGGFFKTTVTTNK